VFVYWLGGHPEFGDRAAEWLRRAKASKPGSYATSSLTIYETLVILGGLKGVSLRNRDFVEHVLKAFEVLEGGISYEPLTFEDLKRGLQLMEVYRLDLEDAIHAACAMRIGAEEIISNDRDFDNVKELRRVF